MILQYLSHIPRWLYVIMFAIVLVLILLQSFKNHSHREAKLKSLLYLHTIYFLQREFDLIPGPEPLVSYIQTGVPRKPMAPIDLKSQLHQLGYRLARSDEIMAVLQDIAQKEGQDNVVIGQDPAGMLCKFSISQGPQALDKELAPPYLLGTATYAIAPA